MLPTNLPGWTGTEIARVIGAATGLPVSVENDANALADGEAEFGAGRGLTDFACITLGTGVGGGCYTGGLLNRGRHFSPTPLGHISIDPRGRPCNRGQRSCLETYANTAALLRYGKDRYSSAEELIDAANRNEAVALSAIYELAGHLAVGCAITGAPARSPGADPRWRAGAERPARVRERRGQVGGPCLSVATEATQRDGLRTRLPRRRTPRRRRYTRLGGTVM